MNRTPQLYDFKIDETKIEGFDKVKFPSNLKYFDQDYIGAIINKDGLIKLIKTLNRKEKILISHYVDLKFPLNEPLIFPFMTDISEQNSNREISYRWLSDQNTLREIECELSRCIDREISISIEWGLIITWHNVIPDKFDKVKFKSTNSFQLVLVKASQQTFLIYNYFRLEWTFKSRIITPYLGYNANDGQSYYLITSLNNITEAHYNSNCGIPSKWIFKVDSKSNKF